MGYVEKLRSIIGHEPIILVGAVVVVINDNKEILLQKRKFPDGIWGIPGGLMELGESTEETARRELKEETGLEVGNLKMIDILSGSEYFVTCSNGDKFYSVTIAYYTNEIINKKMVNDKKEAWELKFFKKDEIPVNILKSHKKIINKLIKLYKFNI